MRWSHLCLPGFLFLTWILTWPLARDFGRSLPTVVELPDALLQVYILNWDIGALSTRPLGVFDAPIFHPEPRTLTYMDHLLGEALVASPISALTRNPAAAYNAVVVFSFLASAWAMYRLVRLLGVSSSGAFLCGLLFTFSPYRYCNMANLNLLQTEFIPLALLLALRFLRERKTRYLVGTGVTLAVQSYFSWYYTFYLATALVVVFVYHIAGGRLRGRDLLQGRVLVTAAFTALLILPGLYPYLKQGLTMPGFRRSIGAAALWSADVFDYLKINVENRLVGGIRWLSGDQPYFPGLVTVVLAALGLQALARQEPSPSTGPTWASRARVGSAEERGLLSGPRPEHEPTRALGARWARRLGDGGCFAAVGLVGFVLSLGPVLRVAGHLLLVPLPYAVLFFVVPGFSSMRAPGRFAVLVLTAAVVLAGFGYEWCRRRVAPSGGWRGRALFSATLGAAIVLTLSTPLPTVAFPHRRSMPPIYEWLARQPGDFAVLDLPVPAREQDEGPRELTRQIYSLYHRKALVDGASGFVPPRHRIFRTVMLRFPEPEAIRAAAERGTRIIIVHYGDFAPATRERLQREVDHAPELRQVARIGSDAAYAITARSGPTSP